MTRGMRLEIHFPEDARHQKAVLHEWLFGAARWIGIEGGAMYKAVAGYGRHGELRDEGFFDPDRTQPMMACFITTPLLADKFLGYLESEGLRLFYVRTEVEYGVIGTPPQRKE